MKTVRWLAASLLLASLATLIDLKYFHTQLTATADKAVLKPKGDKSEDSAKAGINKTSDSTLNAPKEDKSNKQNSERQNTDGDAEKAETIDKESLGSVEDTWTDSDEDEFRKQIEDTEIEDDDKAAPVAPAEVDKFSDGDSLDNPAVELKAGDSGHFQDVRPDVNEKSSGPADIASGTAQGDGSTAPIFVLMLSYQRSGSSFIADGLFKWNPDVFFLYEPLEQLYGTMFGVAEGWTVPSDITIDADGELRILPPEELQAVSWYLEQLYTCNVTSLPVSIFLHRFWDTQSAHMLSLKEFVKCMAANKTLSVLKICRGALLKQLCGDKFGHLGSEPSVCFRLLWQRVEQPDDIVTQENIAAVRSYKKCVNNYTAPVTDCLPYFQNVCSSRPVHAIKTVRGTMQSVEPLLKKYPNFRVIHMYRDPRGAVRSRRAAGWSQGVYEAKTQSVSGIARVYCQTVRADYQKGRELLLKYPGRIFTLLYDDFVADPVRKLKEVYKFIGFPLNDTFVERVKPKIVTEKSAFIKLQWKEQFSPKQVLDIQKECGPLVNEVHFQWDAYNH